MPLADDIEITLCADEDLRSIGGPPEERLFGQLSQLPEMSDRDCPELPWQPSDPPRRRARFGEYVAVFYLHEAPAGTVAIVERVLRCSDLEDWLDREGLRVKVEEEAE